MIPSEILSVKGMMMIVRKTGIASSMLSRLTFCNGESMYNPTMINAGAVAADGTIKNNGAQNKAMANKTATESAVIPVLPPSATPAALST